MHWLNDNVFFASVTPVDKSHEMQFKLYFRVSMNEWEQGNPSEVWLILIVLMNYQPQLDKTVNNEHGLTYEYAI